MPETPEFLPPIDQLPARPSTYEDRGAAATPEDPGAAPEVPARRRRRTQAEMLAGVPPHSAQGPSAPATAPPVTLPPMGAPFHPDSAEEVFGENSPPVFPPIQTPSTPITPPVFPAHINTASPPPFPPVYMQASAPPAPEIVLTSGPTVSVHLGTTANIGNFENIKYDIGLDGVPFNASDAEVEQIMNQSLATQQTMMDRMGAHLLARVAAVKQARGVTD